jgi:hypothetical protein
MKPHRNIAPILLAALVASACDGVVGPGVGEIRRAGVIEHFGDPVSISIPDRVTAGEEFAVQVRTYGGGCVRAGDTQVQTVGTVAVVEPFDLEQRDRDVACPDVLRLIAHTAVLRFPDAGTATVRVAGRRAPNGGRITVERAVQVVPAS